MIKKVRNKNIRINYYTDEINDDFGTIPLSKNDTSQEFLKYHFTRGNKFSRFWCDVFYYGIARPILYLVCLFSGVKIINKENYKKYRKECKKRKIGGFIYENHVSNYDAFLIPAYLFKKGRVDVVAFANSLNNKFLKNIMNALGYLPLADDLKTYRLFLKAMDQLVKDEEHILIFPEAHIWPYYTKIRPFIDGSFAYPLKYKAPVLPLICAFRKSKFSKKPKRTLLIGEPILLDEFNNNKEDRKRLRDLVFNEMNRLSSIIEQEEYIKYIKVDQNKINELN